MALISFLFSLMLVFAAQGGPALAQQQPPAPQQPAAQQQPQPVAGNLGAAQSGVATARQELAALQREVVKHLYQSSQNEQAVLRTGHVDLLARIQDASLTLTALGDVLAIYDAVPKKTDVVVKSRVLNRVEAGAQALNDTWIIGNAFEKQSGPTPVPGGLAPLKTRFGEVIYKAVVALNPLLQELNAY